MEIQANKCAAVHCKIKEKANEKSGAKTNSTHNVKVICDVRMTMENGK